MHSCTRNDTKITRFLFNPAYFCIYFFPSTLRENTNIYMEVKIIHSTKSMVKHYSLSKGEGVHQVLLFHCTALKIHVVFTLLNWAWTSCWYIICYLIDSGSVDDILGSVRISQSTQCFCIVDVCWWYGCKKTHAFIAKFLQ